MIVTQQTDWTMSCADGRTDSTIHKQHTISVMTHTASAGMSNYVPLETLLDFLKETKDDSLRHSLIVEENRARIAGEFLAAASMELTNLAMPISSVKVIGILISRLVTILAEFAPDTNNRVDNPIDMMSRGMNKILQLLTSDIVCVEPRNPANICHNELSDHSLGLLTCRSNGCVLITNCAHLLERHAEVCSRPWSNTPYRQFSIHLDNALPFLSDAEREICGTSLELFRKNLQGFTPAPDLMNRVYGGMPMVINVSTEPDVITIELDENNPHGNLDANIPMPVSHLGSANPVSSEQEEEYEDSATEDSEEGSQRVVVTRESLILQHQAESLRISAYTVQDPFAFEGPLKEEYLRHRSNLRMVITDQENNHEFSETCQWCRNEVVQKFGRDEKRDHKHQPIMVQCEKKCPTSTMHLECLLEYSSHAINAFKTGNTDKALNCLRCCAPGASLNAAIPLMTKKEYSMMLLYVDPIIRCLFCRQPRKPAKHLLECAKSTIRRQTILSMDIKKFAHSLKKFLGVYDERSTEFLQLPHRHRSEFVKTMRPVVAKSRIQVGLKESKYSLTILGLLHLVKAHAHAATMLLDSNIRSCWDREFGILIRKMSDWADIFDHSDCKLGSCLTTLTNDVFKFVASVHEAILLFLPQNHDSPITKCIREQRSLRSDPTCNVCELTFESHEVANKHFQEEDDRTSVTPWLQPFDQILYRHLKGHGRRSLLRIARFCEVDRNALRMILNTIRIHLMTLEIRSNQL